MIFAFDMDGTITANPRVLGEIMRSLKKNGNTVYILTGSLGETSDEKLEKYRAEQAASLGIGKDCFDEIVIAVHPAFEGVADLKGNFCRDYKVDFMIDDMALYIQAIKRNSPGTFVAAVV